MVRTGSKNMVNNVCCVVCLVVLVLVIVLLVRQDQKCEGFAEEVTMNNRRGTNSRAVAKEVIMNNRRGTNSRAVEVPTHNDVLTASQMNVHQVEHNKTVGTGRKAAVFNPAQAAAAAGTIHANQQFAMNVKPGLV
jgi:hypothetical protein